MGGEHMTEQFFRVLVGRRTRKGGLDTFLDKVVSIRAEAGSEDLARGYVESHYKSLYEAMEVIVSHISEITPLNAPSPTSRHTNTPAEVVKKRDAKIKYRARFTPVEREIYTQIEKLETQISEKTDIIRKSVEHRVSGFIKKMYTHTVSVNTLKITGLTNTDASCEAYLFDAVEIETTIQEVEV
jgi:hypothetical protein